MPVVNPALYTTTATVNRYQSTSDNAGGWTQTLTAVGAIKCRITDAQLVQRTDQQGRLGADLVRQLYCQPGTSLKAGDKIVADGTTYSVESVSEPSGHPYRKCLIVEETPG